MTLPAPYYETELGKLYHGDALEVLKSLPNGIVQTCVTSPPYWGLRSYLPDRVVLKKDAPSWVLKEIEGLGIFPFIHSRKNIDNEYISEK